MLPHSMEDAALNAHLYGQEKREAADGMTYRELLTAYDEVSEAGDWALTDILRGKISECKSDARIALRKAFKDAASLLPFPARIMRVVDGEIECAFIDDWIRECADTKQYSEMMLDMLIGTRTRDSIIAAMADEYVELVVDDLLMADFQPE